MLSTPRRLATRARRQVRADLAQDPHLRYILALSAALNLFWIWHRLPNFATIDEWSRLLDSTYAVSRVIEEPSITSLQEGISWSRVPFGATFYLFAIALLPVVLFAMITGNLEIFANLEQPVWAFRFYNSYQSMPGWVWFVGGLTVRLFNVVFALGCVYLTYRIGTAAYDRFAGNLAALFLTLSFGFVTIAHEAGEDMPALFFVLLAVYMMLRYVQDGEGTLFLAGSAAGGVALAFKLTAAPIILVIGIAFLLRARHADRFWRDGVFKPKLFLGGAGLGLLFILLGFPTLLVGTIDPVYARLFEESVGRAGRHTGPTAPVWWWFLRGYFSGLSLPLFVAGVGGVVASVFTIRRREGGVDGTLVILAALFAYIALFSGWHDFRVHHLLPTFPFVLLLLADGIDRLEGHWPTIGRAALALLVVTSGLYAVVGTLGYASMPRDQAVGWLDENAADNDTVEVYRRTFQDTAVPFDVNISHPHGSSATDEFADPCPRYIQLGYRDLLYLDPDAFYYQGTQQYNYINDLLNGRYNYEVVATFGPEPSGPGFEPDRPTPGSFEELLHLGVIPHTSQYGDEQELDNDQFIVMLERTGPCSGDRSPPF